MTYIEVSLRGVRFFERRGNLQQITSQKMLAMTISITYCS